LLVARVPGGGAYIVIHFIFHGNTDGLAEQVERIPHVDAEPQPLAEPVGHSQV